MLAQHPHQGLDHGAQLGRPRHRRVYVYVDLRPDAIREAVQQLFLVPEVPVQGIGVTPSSCASFRIVSAPSPVASVSASALSTTALLLSRLCPLSSRGASATSADRAIDGPC
jgi:hypothetical protein